MKKTLSQSSILITIMLMGPFAYSQQTELVLPPSPTVASLGKYGSIPVGHYTGIPNINIPIYTIASGPLQLPISMSYHAGGIKVEEVASPVGLGWTLNAGGAIGRSIRGLPDELGWYPQSSTNTVEYIMLNGTFEQQNQFIEDVRKGYKDGEPDQYYYNLAGSTGKFFLDQVSGEGHSVPLRNIRIRRNPHWEITDEQGNLYTFEKEESVDSDFCGNDQINTTAWFLTSIKSADGKHQITLTYEWSYYTFTTLGTETKYISTDGSGSACMQNQSCLGTHNYRTHRLLRIDFANGYLKFNHLTTRCDLVDDKRLDQIEIFTSDDTLIKRFTMDYDYFGNNADCSRLTEESKRLKLMSITEKSGTENKPPYSFFYNEEVSLPSRLSYAQDHWGYFNGKINNPGLVATFVNISSSGSMIIEKGADRRTDPTKAQASVLARIVYPTGGETIFTFESNEVSDDRVDPQVEEETLYLGASNYLVRDLPSPYESATQMVIPEGGALVNFSVSGLDAQLWQGCDIVDCYVIRDNNITTPFRELESFSNGGAEQWPAGTYKLRLVTECGYDAIANFSVTVNATIPIMELLDTRPVGGLRVVQIEDKPTSDAPSMLRTFQYHQEADPTKSSGVLINFPDYGYDLNVTKRICTEPIGSPAGPDELCAYRVRTSTSNYPLAVTQSGFVGYAHVIEATATNGQSSYDFQVYPNIEPIYPFAQVENFDWRRGWMTSSTDFVNQNGALIKLKKVSSSPWGGDQLTIYGLKTGCTAITVGNCTNPEPCTGKVYDYYPLISEPFEIGQRTETVFQTDDLSKFVEKKTEYTYNTQHIQLQEIKTTSSKTNTDLKEESVTKRKYPLDYTFSGTPVGDQAVGIKKLQDLHVIGKVVEEYIVMQNAGTSGQISNQRVTSGLLYTFKPDNPYPDQVYQLESAVPIPSSEFGTGSIINSNAFQFSSLYKPVANFLNYDIKGNVMTHQKTGDVPTTYIWGYNRIYPIAEITNALSTVDVAFTSFEEDIKGNWNYVGVGTNPVTQDARSGQKTYELTGANPVSKDGLSPAMIYTLSYWYRNGSNITISGVTPSDVATSVGSDGWTFFSGKVTGTTSLSISGSGEIDELRIHPVGSRMRTFTYQPLTGISSQTDVNNITTHFKYDSFGRLLSIKDHEGNIVKTHDYHYKGQ